MASLLIALIYLTFISLGLPDSLLGAAWPAMHLDLQAPIAAQSGISIIISCCTVASSLATARLVRRLGTGGLCALSVAATAAAIIAFGFARSYWQLCLLSVPYGLGAGAIDAALNNHVALHHGARHMSWLHCCWGIGASIGPVVMGWALAGPAGWRAGYLAIGGIQVAIALTLALSLPLWRSVQRASRTDRDQGNGTGDVRARALSHVELLKLPGAASAIGSFGTYCALESSIGLWSATYLVYSHHMASATAAGAVSNFYIGITAGRLVSGLIAQWMASETQIRFGQMLIALGLVLLVGLGGGGLAWAAMTLMGLGCAPIYPSIVALTPRRFGEDASQGLIGLQMACAYTGAMLVPPALGLVAGAGHAALIPLLLALMLAVHGALAEHAARITHR
ncbi:MAG: MFS transporter [Collinsella sp.]|nr:MFS transporter [Collinsella sp.]